MILTNDELPFESRQWSFIKCVQIRPITPITISPVAASMYEYIIVLFPHPLCVVSAQIN